MFQDHVRIAIRIAKAPDLLRPVRRTLWHRGSFNTRRDTVAQSKSAFHSKQGTSPHELDNLNALIERYHSQRGGMRSYHIALEDFAPSNFTRLARWLGFGSCSFSQIPTSNRASSYVPDAEGVEVHCDQSSRSSEAERIDSQLTFGIKVCLSSSAPTCIEPSVGNMSLAVSQHMSDFAERRRALGDLVQSIRVRYSSPIIVAYEGKHVYEHTCAQCVYFRMQGPLRGLSAGRNLIVRLTSTPFLMIMDDDVLFHDATRVGVLVRHLLHDLSLALVAACYHPADCYAYSFATKEGGMLLEEVAQRADGGLHVAQLTHNVFVARTSVLRKQHWDERQLMIEHETFFANLEATGHRVAFDPNVTVVHRAEARTKEYLGESLRFSESRYLQYLCRNFPRIQWWSLVSLRPSFKLSAAYTPAPPRHRSRQLGTKSIQYACSPPHSALAHALSPMSSSIALRKSRKRIGISIIKMRELPP